MLDASGSAPSPARSTCLAAGASGGDRLLQWLPQAPAAARPRSSGGRQGYPSTRRGSAAPPAPPSPYDRERAPRPSSPQNQVRRWRGAMAVTSRCSTDTPPCLQNGPERQPALYRPVDAARRRRPRARRSEPDSYQTPMRIQSGADDRRPPRLCRHGLAANCAASSSTTRSISSRLGCCRMGTLRRRCGSGASSRRLSRNATVHAAGVPQTPAGNPELYQYRVANINVAHLLRTLLFTHAH